MCSHGRFVRTFDCRQVEIHVLFSPDSSMNKRRDRRKSLHSMPPKTPRWLRAAGALWMLAFIIWLPFEDTQTWMSLALAAAGCLWLGIRWLTIRSQLTSRLGNLAAGALLGAAAPLLAITLMALKSGLHAHGFADFTARQLWEVMALIPVSAILGIIISLGVWKSEVTKRDSLWKKAISDHQSLLTKNE